MNPGFLPLLSWLCKLLWDFTYLCWNLTIMDKWAYERGIELDFSRPGKPTDNAKVESFNGRLRQECLNAHWFLSLEDARRKIDEWRQYYNETEFSILDRD
jgi:transposase InsO family protein